MKHIGFILLILFSLGFTEPTSTKTNEGEYVISGIPAFPQDEKIMADLKASIEAEGLRVVKAAKNYNGYVVKSEREFEELITVFRVKNSIVEENIVYKIPDIPERKKAGLQCKDPNDPGEDPGDPGPPQPPQTIHYGLKKIQAPEAWNLGHTGKGVKLAVLDTGIDKNHPDLEANIVGGEDYTGAGDYWDDNDHGTHCAGIIAASNNNIGTAGVAPDASLWVGKVLDGNGFGDNADITDGIYGSVLAGAQIISMSFGGGFSLGIESAMEHAYLQGIKLVCAAGNETTDKKIWPAGSDFCIGIASLNEQDEISSFSNFGSWVSAAMYGSSIYSTVPNDDYAVFSGTSMAAPMYAGALAHAIESGKPLVTKMVTVKTITGDEYIYPVPNVFLTVSQ